MVTGQLTRNLAPRNFSRAHGDATHAAPHEHAREKHGEPSSRRHHFETEYQFCGWRRVRLQSGVPASYGVGQATDRGAGAERFGAILLRRRTRDKAGQGPDGPLRPRILPNERVSDAAVLLAYREKVQTSSEFSAADSIIQTPSGFSPAYPALPLLWPH